MAKASRKQTILVDRQLAGINVAEAKRKWREGLPVSLKQMSVALELGYSTVRNYSKMAGFPMLKGCVFPRLFDTWLKECFREQSSGASSMPQDGVISQTGDVAETVLGKNASSRLPIQAQRLMTDAGVRK